MNAWMSDPTRALDANPVKRLISATSPGSSRYAEPAGPIYPKEQLEQIAQTVLRLSKSDVVRVQIQHQARAVTRLANNRVLTSDNGSALTITMVTSVGGRLSVSYNTNQADEASLRIAIARLDALSREQFGGAENYLYVPDKPQTYLPVNLWHENSVRAMATVGDTVVPHLIRALNAANMRGSGFVGMMAQRVFNLQKDGLSAFGEETDGECTVSARSADGKASGWYGQASRDWSTIQPQLIAEKAIDIARRNMNAQAVEPGRRTAILSPFALAQIMRHVSRGFDAFMTNHFHATVFTVIGNPERDNKIGMQVFDPSIVITSNPADPEGGYFPFGEVHYDGLALPTRNMTYVDHGVLQDLAYNQYYSLLQGKPFNQNPWSMRLDTVPGTKLMTEDEMIANCKEGIYVNRLSDVDELDPITGMQTGVTRDGCFLIKDGKISRPVKNFRFADSPMYFLNRLVGISKPQRVALGFTPPAPREPGYASNWPRRPLIMPAVMVNDFNFSSLSDAV